MKFSAPSASLREALRDQTAAPKSPATQPSHEIGHENRIAPETTHGTLSYASTVPGSVTATPDSNDSTASDSGSSFSFRAMIPSRMRVTAAPPRAGTELP